MAPRKKGDATLTGVQKAAIILMTVEVDVASKIFGMMNEHEIKEISQGMSSLGTVKSDLKDGLIKEFVEELSEGQGLIGTVENTEKLLSQVLGKEKVSAIMEDISGPAGRNTWDKLNNVGEEVLAAFLRNEYPQTVALVLSKIRTAQAASVLSVLPEEFALDVIQRMISMEPVKREVLMGIENTLQAEFMSNLNVTKKYDSLDAVAEIFNNFDRNTESRYMELLEQEDQETAEKVRDLMFTFDDLVSIDNAGIQVLIRSVDKEQLPIALKGASDEIRELFFSNMSERAGKILKDDMESRGPVRMKEVDEAQTAMVAKAKELAESGEIIIPEGGEDEEMIE